MSQGGEAAGECSWALCVIRPGSSQPWAPLPGPETVALGLWALLDHRRNSAKSSQLFGLSHELISHLGWQGQVLCRVQSLPAAVFSNLDAACLTREEGSV